MENQSKLQTQQCHNCVYYKPRKDNYYIGWCCIDDNPKNYEEWDSGCHRWRTNKYKYGLNLNSEEEKETN